MKLKDVIHYYIWQQVQHPDGHSAKLIGVDVEELHLIHEGSGSYGTSKLATMDVRPILRRLSQLTDNEKIAWIDLVWRNQTGQSLIWKIDVVNNWLGNTYEEGEAFSPTSFHYLLSIGIDLFGLIDSGQAIGANSTK
jgi:hypothetical protein